MVCGGGSDSHEDANGRSWLWECRTRCNQPDRIRPISWKYLVFQPIILMILLYQSEREPVFLTSPI